MQLIDLQSGQPINIETARVVTFAGEIGVIVEATPPAHEGELGRVFFRRDGTSYVREMTPQVIGAKWTDGSEAV